MNQEECADIARRAAEHISVLKRLDEDEELSEDLRERLGRYHRVLEDVSRTVERIGSTPKRERIFRTTSVQEETKGCLDKLNDAYQMYIFKLSIAADNKLTTLVNGMRAMALSSASETLAVGDEPDEIRRIPVETITFLEEISCMRIRGYIVRFDRGRMIDRFGQHKSVIVKKFHSSNVCEDSVWDAFDTEVELRRDLLGCNVNTSLTLLKPATVYYFAYPPNPNGSVPDPPGFWSFSADPHCCDQHVCTDDAQAQFWLFPYVEYETINHHILPLFQDLDSHGFISAPAMTYASNAPFAPDSANTNLKRSKKGFGDALLSVFTKKRVPSHS
ncbi:hypothetical protein SISSUDRAFT_1037562 [Sistotremastrum suecicum HHB10207 ss-3]|uniref:Uncharacterized protein n=1 Tax=Sistotremastrum suecicum HHB10207 ss-3 TaxID=1314776 RepID=A0A165XYK9_9AGAM|nr:hypothetical protein SISSUDRAFT_1037562 [Sistotremastrum suecicum HHB10207 ss-3]